MAKTTTPRKKSTTQVPSLQIRGMLAFTTASVARSLDAGRPVHQGPECSLPLSEMALFGTIQCEFWASPEVQKALLTPLTRSHGGEMEALHWSACLHPTTGFHARETICDLHYVVDLNRVYWNAEKVSSELKESWFSARHEVADNAYEFASERPEILLVVLSSGDSETHCKPGSVLPSFVDLTGGNVDMNQEQLAIRLCGFPPSAEFSLITVQLHRMLAHNSSDQSLVDHLNRRRWCFCAPPERFIELEWCSIRFLSTDFIRHSLFFLEWCAPCDFHWFPQQCLPGTEGCWGRDILGSLLLEASERSATSSPVHTAEVDICSPEDQRKSEVQRGYSSSFDGIPSVDLRLLARSAVTEVTKLNVDVAFVEQINRIVHSPRGALVVEGLLGQLNLMREICYSSSFLEHCRIPQQASALHKCSGIAATGNTAETYVVPFPLRGQAARVLCEWQRLHRMPNIQNDSLSLFCDADAGLRQASGRSFPEILQKRFVSGASRSLVSEQHASFSLTAWALKLMESPCVTEGDALQFHGDVAELADLVEVQFALESSTTGVNQIGKGQRVAMEWLPQGVLRDTLEASLSMYVSSLDAHDSNTKVANTVCGVANCELARAGEEDLSSHASEVMLDALGRTILECSQVVGGNCRRRTRWSSRPLHELVSVNGFWATVLEELGHEVGCTVSHAARNTCRVGPEPVNLCDVETLRKLLHHAACSRTQVQMGCGDRWLRHIAFILAHGTVSNESSSFIAEDVPLFKLFAHRCSPQTNTTEVESKAVMDKKRTGLLARALGAQLFNLDIVHCALDHAILERWKRASKTVYEKCCAAESGVTHSTLRKDNVF
ncbi:hypothetical protein ERJ75_000773200 [Trypanosoma vivax]|uniref:Uncharacterized protein n=1 Tax=Trypanosoma vivax (strain Y486) TaxID=1055687 RepID=G0U3K0_TRYVY|nr:hypothetical protein TRVL_02752 [Trypanosoma vivax]KAH8613951.1 hypothetical protein ERJ75_000773200 [Trypanosoma vivax]CCC50857.1 conserved hypothetical protein [Trypanosoma vivax Y486]